MTAARCGFAPIIRPTTRRRPWSTSSATGSLSFPRGELDDHRLLYLFLHDAWTDLYGKPFADRMAAIERRIPGAYDYDAAWTWALARPGKRDRRG